MTMLDTTVRYAGASFGYTARPADPPGSEPWSPDARRIARAIDARPDAFPAALIHALYRIPRLRRLARRLCTRRNGGLLYSRVWREVLRRWHGVEVGRYSYGDILLPSVLPAGSRVGAYCSVGTGLIVRRRDHPLDRPLLHPFFYNSALGLLKRDTIPLDRENPLHVGHGVWIGDRVTILSGCRSIGNGSVIAAGAVVTHDVPPYAIVGGVPAKVIRMRFTPDSMASIEATRWWERDISSLLEEPVFASYLEPV